jgi:hypothetical protein
MAETGVYPQKGPSTAARFREGGYAKHKQSVHLTRGAPLGFRQMPHASGSHEQRSHQKKGERR